MEHLEAVRKRVQDAPVKQPSRPWAVAGVFAVGGLTEVGFADGTDLLLVVSSHGRAVFDCRTGTRLERNRLEPDESWYDGRRLRAKGIGPLSEGSIRLAGLHGGGLLTSGRDGWWVETLTLDWPAESLILGGPWGCIYDDKTPFTKLTVDSEVRAFGFSDSGETLVIATASEVTMISWTE